MQLINQFFATARERFNIMINKDAGRPREEWTNDPVFKKWRFCNVHREHDKTTQWFRENVRNHVGGWGAVQATIAFRWFNRIETAEKIVHLLTDGWDSEEARELLEGTRPVVNGAYIILGQQGYDKLEGVIRCIDMALERLHRKMDDEAHEMWELWGESLQGCWSDLRELPYVGRFMAYEFVTDLRHTDVLNRANDIMTWASAGPGCARGLGWVMNDNPTTFNYGSQTDQAEMTEIMREILLLSEEDHFWPLDWKPRWEMREVEHWACEFDKYKRAERGDRMKRSYK